MNTITEMVGGFTITLQTKLPHSAEVVYPFCVNGSGGMLIENCGGPHCYNLISAWAREKTKANEDAMLAMWDADIMDHYKNYNAAAFNIDEINDSIGEKNA
jgi:hypothetical protein